MNTRDSRDHSRQMPSVIKPAITSMPEVRSLCSLSCLWTSVRLVPEFHFVELAQVMHYVVATAGNARQSIRFDRWQ